MVALSGEGKTGRPAAASESRMVLSVRELSLPGEQNLHVAEERGKTKRADKLAGKLIERASKGTLRFSRHNTLGGTGLPRARGLLAQLVCLMVELVVGMVGALVCEFAAGFARREMHARVMDRAAVRVIGSPVSRAVGAVMGMVTVYSTSERAPQGFDPRAGACRRQSSSGTPAARTGPDGA
jgi:hypothetical protein